MLTVKVRAETADAPARELLIPLVKNSLQSADIVTTMVQAKLLPASTAGTRAYRVSKFTEPTSSFTSIRNPDLTEMRTKGVIVQAPIRKFHTFIEADKLVLTVYSWELRSGMQIRHIYDNLYSDLHLRGFLYDRIKNRLYDYKDDELISNQTSLRLDVGYPLHVRVEPGAAQLALPLRVPYGDTPTVEHVYEAMTERGFTGKFLNDDNTLVPPRSEVFSQLSYVFKIGPPAFKPAPPMLKLALDAAAAKPKLTVPKPKFTFAPAVVPKPALALKQPAAAAASGSALYSTWILDDSCTHIERGARLSESSIRNPSRVAYRIMNSASPSETYQPGQHYAIIPVHGDLPQAAVKRETPMPMPGPNRLTFPNASIEFGKYVRASDIIRAMFASLPLPHDALIMDQHFHLVRPSLQAEYGKEFLFSKPRFSTYQGIPVHLRTPKLFDVETLTKVIAGRSPAQLVQQLHYDPAAFHVAVRLAPGDRLDAAFTYFLAPKPVAHVDE